MRDERIKTGGARRLAVEGGGLASNLRHALILTSGPHVSSNGGGHHSTPRKQRKLYRSPSPGADAARALTSATHSPPGARRVTGCSAQPRPRQYRKVRDDPGQVAASEIDAARTRLRYQRGAGELWAQPPREPHAHDAPTRIGPPRGRRQVNALPRRRLRAEFLRNPLERRRRVLTLFDLAAGRRTDR